MQHAVPVDTPVGIITGGDAISLDENALPATFGADFTLVGHFNGRHCSRDALLRKPMTGSRSCWAMARSGTPTSPADKIAISVRLSIIRSPRRLRPGSRAAR